MAAHGHGQDCSNSRCAGSAAAVPAPSLCVPVLVPATDAKGPHHGDLRSKMQKRLQKIDLEGAGRVTVRGLA